MKPTVDDDLLSIDADRLDEEWLSQPKRYFEAAAHLADARQEQEEAKAELAVVAAELNMAIRDSPAEYDVRKVTDKSVEAAVLLQAEYKQALKALNKARHAVDIYQALVTALDHRKKALENMVQLHGQNYFSTPRASGVGREVAEKIERASVARRAMKRRD